MMTEQERVTRNTPERINRIIKIATDETIYYYSKHIDQIPERLAELDNEWDIERVLQTNAASLSLAGVLLSLKVSKKWMLLPLVVGGFLLQHAIQGWCPPLPLLRRMGVRTKDEINREKVALFALQGKFTDLANIKEIPEDERVDKILRALDE